MVPMLHGSRAGRWFDADNHPVGRQPPTL